MGPGIKYHWTHANIRPANPKMLHIHKIELCAPVLDPMLR